MPERQVCNVTVLLMKGNVISQRLVVVSKFRTRFPDYDPAVLDLLPYTNSASALVWMIN
jgi:hypothetical protein